ncbi:hypothetical protein, partial [uncultured Shewanella sp.]|uniref:hypothetical protein n=1 Tax=uncultured Shewanella sp. TaxID=173975 RepID=UPI002610287E
TIIPDSLTHLQSTSCTLYKHSTSNIEPLAEPLAILARYFPMPLSILSRTIIPESLTHLQSTSCTLL